MDYIEEIIRLLTWPAVIILSYYAVVAALKRWDKFLPAPDEDRD